MKRFLNWVLPEIALAFIGTVIMTMTPTFAADIYKAPRRAAEEVVAAPVNYWNGFYASIGWGYGWGDANPSFSNPTVSGLSNTCKWKGCESPSQQAMSALSEYGSAGIFNQRDSGALLGGGLGWDWRFSQAMLVGLEAEWNKTWIKGSTIYNGSQLTREVKSLGLLTARVGYIFPDGRNLLYVKGGGAWRNETISVVGLGSGSKGGGSSDPSIGYASGENSNTTWGWALGGGWEHVLSPSGQWRLRLEGMHARFKDQDTPLSGTVTVPVYKGPPSVGTYSANVRTEDRLTYFKVSAIWHPWN